MHKPKLLLSISILPFLTFGILVLKASSFLIPLLCLAYSLAWIAGWVLAAKKKWHGFRWRHFWIAVVIIVISVPIQGFIIGLSIFGLD